MYLILYKVVERLPFLFTMEELISKFKEFKEWLYLYREPSGQKIIDKFEELGLDQLWQDL